MFSNSKDLSAYLIGQISKNFKYSQYLTFISINEILNAAQTIILPSHKNIGGRFIFLDCKKENSKVAALYESNGFKSYLEITMSDGSTYLQMVKIF